MKKTIDTASGFARKYAEVSQWQYRRGLGLLALAAPTPDLHDWFEGTSNGRFQAANLPHDARADLARRFPGPLSCPIKALRMILQRR